MVRMTIDRLADNPLSANRGSPMQAVILEDRHGWYWEVNEQDDLFIRSQERFADRQEAREDMKRQCNLIVGCLKPR